MTAPRDLRQWRHLAGIPVFIVATRLRLSTEELQAIESGERIVDSAMLADLRRLYRIPDGAPIAGIRQNPATILTRRP